MPSQNADRRNRNVPGNASLVKPTTSQPPAWFTGQNTAGQSNRQNKDKNKTGTVTYDPNTGKFSTPSSRFGQQLDVLTGRTAFQNAVPAWASEARFVNALNATPSAPGYRPMGATPNNPNYTPATPSWYQAAAGAVQPAGSTYMTRGGGAGRNEGGYVIPAPYAQAAPTQSGYEPTSMPIIERNMAMLNGMGSPFLPSWFQDQSGYTDWWGNYHGYKRGHGGGGYGGYGGGNYSNPWYTGLFQLNANR